MGHGGWHNSQKAGKGGWHDTGMSVSQRLQGLPALAVQLWRDARAFPWRNTAITLRERFREDRLGLTASSLTFTTLIALVPLFSVTLAVFSAFPMFARLEAVLQRWLVQSLVPPNIASQVMEYLNQFASKAGEIGWVGALVLLITALALILTIDRKLNDIWRVRRPRPLARRILVYWAVLTLGPLLLALLLTLTSTALALSQGVMGDAPGARAWLLDGLRWTLMVLGTAALYRHVPNTTVRWSHALVGGVFVATGLRLGQQVLSWYLASVPTYSVVYGAFAILPILMLWMYLAWVVVLLGAVVVAYLPSLLAGVARRGDSPGWDFQLALETVSVLHGVQGTAARGLPLPELADRLRVDVLQLEVPLACLMELDWVARLDEEGERLVLMAQPGQTAMAPLLERTLLPLTPATRALWERQGWHRLTLEQALTFPEVEPWWGQAAKKPVSADNMPSGSSVV